MPKLGEKKGRRKSEKKEPRLKREEKGKMRGYRVAEKGRDSHSGTLAWKIPWMEKPGRLQSMGSPRVGHN